MRLRLIITALLLLLVLVFAVQNGEVVEVVSLFWGLSLPRSLLVFLVFLVGGAVGWSLRSTVKTIRAEHQNC